MSPPPRHMLHHPGKRRGRGAGCRPLLASVARTWLGLALVDMAVDASLARPARKNSKKRARPGRVLSRFSPGIRGHSSPWQHADGDTLLLPEHHHASYAPPPSGLNDCGGAAR
eukprot:gene18013-biopygen12931